MHTHTDDIDNIFSSNTVHKAIIGIIIPQFQDLLEQQTLYNS